jgi:uncharacterized RDD family membrane protein YckC
VPGAVVDTTAVDAFAAPRDPTAVIGRRIAAWLVDAVIVFAIAGTMYASSAVRYENEIGVDDPCTALEQRGIDTGSCVYVGDEVYVTSAGDAAAATAVTWGYAAAVFVVLQGLAGVTPGKLVTGLRVVDEAGRRPGLGKAAVRTVLWVVDGAPWIFPLVGFITGLTTTGHRRIGDMAAKTYVVARADAGAPIALPGTEAPAVFTSPYGSPVPTGAGPPAAGEPEIGEPAVLERPRPAAAQPVWDDRWGAWVTWDEPSARWLRWDAAASRWVPMQ